ncbi:MAG: amidohydrolase family protein, partial [Candidatus Omnitrophica bacterium]|nr:amidohydrolase family protein [Candidatus Omnitrophota bacterium]
MIIDMHTHAWPEKVSASARQNLEGLFKVKLVGEPTLATLREFMDKNGISVSAVAAVATKPEQVPSINNWLMEVRSERIKVFCALHPDYPLWQEELERLRGKIDGIKVQPEFQDFYVDEERLDPMYAMIQEMGLPLLFHCGEELSGTMLVRSSPVRLVRVKERFGRLKIIAAHFGGFRLW